MTCNYVLTTAKKTNTMKNEYTFKLDGLAKLSSHMGKNYIPYTIFNCTINEVEFDVYYSMSTNPFRLLIVQIGSQFTIDLQVEKGYLIKSNLGSKFSMLCKVLGLKFDPNNKYNSNKFFTSINTQIPSTANLYNGDKAKLYTYVIKGKKERNEGIYYSHPIRWTKRTRSNENSEKVFYWFSNLYKIIKDFPHISIAFTDQPSNKDYMKEVMEIKNSHASQQRSLKS